MVERLRVAIDAAEVLPERNGGVAQAIQGLVHALGELDDGPEDYLIIVDSENQIDWLRPFTAANQQFVVKPKSSSPPADRLSPRTVLRPVTRYLRKHLNGKSRQWPEVPISNGFYESLGSQVVHFPHQSFILCGLPSIYTPHDLQHLHYPEFFSAPSIAWRETIYRGGCRFAQTVAVASQWIKQDVLRQYGLPPDKVQIIPWGAPTQTVPEPSPEDLVRVQQKYQLPQPFAIYPAMTWPHKNHLALFQALAHLRSQGVTVQLVATGSRYAPFWPQITASLEALSLESQVKFLGFIPDEDMRAVYRLSQFLVMPTLFESDSFPIYEAWLDGVPVACSNVCALPDQVMDAALVFDPENVQSMANAIARLTNEASLRNDLRERGFGRLGEFNWEYTGKAYRAVYRRLTHRRLTDEERWLLAWDWMREPHKQRESGS